VEKLRILIVSDGRKGHLNQSIAFCKLIEAEYEILEVAFKNRVFKLLSYFFDWIGVYCKRLYKEFVFNCNYDFIVSAGSATYYANKLIAKTCKTKNIALMYPKGYRNDFFRLFAQEHDNPPEDGIKMAVNFSYAKPQGIFKCKKKCVAFIVGGSNSVFEMRKSELKKVIDYIFAKFENYQKAVTTSPRTPPEIEEMIEKSNFDYKLIFSKEPANPIGDFLYCCERVFITIDSTSMISEAVSWGKSCVEIVLLKAKKTPNKYLRMVEILKKGGYLSVFEDSGKTQKTSCKKIDLKSYIKEIF